MNKLNPQLVKMAFASLEQVKDVYEKQAFVSAGDLQNPGQGVAGAPADQPPQGQPPMAPPGAAPAQPPTPDPSQAQQPQQPQQPQQSPLTKDDLNEAVQTALVQSQNKPPKQTTEERITALEGSHIRLLELLGHLDPQKYQQYVTGNTPQNPMASTPPAPAAAPAAPTGVMTSGATGQAVNDPEMNIGGSPTQPQMKTASALEQFAAQMRSA